jgi:hypothetical protein
MPLPSAYLARKLAEPLPTTDGGTLRTIGDATRYMTKLPKHREAAQSLAARGQLGAVDGCSALGSRLARPVAHLRKLRPSVWGAPWD